MKIITWDEKKAKSELQKRLEDAKLNRSKFERFWEQNEALMFEAEGTQSGLLNGSMSPEIGAWVPPDAESSTHIPQNSAYAFKNLRFIHSQMSANPPSVIAEPTSSDPDDRLKARAADRIVHHGRRKYRLAEKIDLLTLTTLVYGTGFLKQVWDTSLGEIVDIDENDNVVLEGDINITVPSVWDVYIDFHAETMADIRYVFHKIHMPLESAISQWPDQEDLLRRAHKENNQKVPGTGNNSQQPQQEEIIEIYEYWEKGLQENGYDGRHALHLADGTVLGEVRPNPHRFLSAETIRKVKQKYESLGEEFVQQKIESVPQVAELPFHILTDIDVPQSVYGKSSLDYVAHIQENMNRILLTIMDNIAAHGSAKIVLPEGSEIADDSIVNTPFEIIKISGAQPPYPMSAPQLLPDMTPMVDRLKQTIDDLMGVNDAMFGQMQRETAGSAMQYATNQGNMIRRRLFNKYTEVVESVFGSHLKLIRKHFDLGRLDHIIGKEHPLETLEVKSIDIDGGYDLKVTYGTSLSLDPITRREEIMALLPLFEKASIPPEVQIEMLDLNELRGLYDENRVAKERQHEIFDEMLEQDIYIPPEANQDHVRMVAAGLRYVMTREYMDLEEDKKLLITQHIEDRKQLAAQEQATGTGMPPGPAPAPGAPVGPAPGPGPIINQ